MWGPKTSSFYLIALLFPIFHIKCISSRGIFVFGQVLPPVWVFLLCLPTGNWRHLDVHYHRKLLALQRKKQKNLEFVINLDEHLDIWMYTSILLEYYPDVYFLKNTCRLLWCMPLGCIVHYHRKLFASQRIKAKNLEFVINSDVYMDNGHMDYGCTLL